MKVLLINTSERTGGAAIACNRLMDALKNNGVRAKMLVRDKQTDRLLVVALRPSVMLPIKFVYERLTIFFHNRFSRKNLFQVDVANAGTDVTHLNEFKQADVIHLHWVNQGFLSLDNLDKIIHSGKKIVITMHDQWYFTGVCHYSGECTKFQTSCEKCELLKGTLYDITKSVFEKKRAIYKDADITFVSCSKWLGNIAKTSLLAQGHKVVSIPNAIDTDLFRPCSKAEARQRQGLPKNMRLLLFGSQKITDERKGFRFLVEACETIKKNHPELSSQIGVVVLGGQSDVVQSQLPFPVFPISYVSDQQHIVDLYNAVDIYVTPSLQDNLPNTIVEAMSCGVPCVGFNVGGIPEMIDHKQNGYVAKYRDADDFAEGIVWTLNQDGYTKLSELSRAKAVATYSQESVANKYIEIYDNSGDGNI